MTRYDSAYFYFIFKKWLRLTDLVQLKRECDTVLIEKHKEVMQVECENYLKDDKRDGA